MIFLLRIPFSGANLVGRRAFSCFSIHSLLLQTIFPRHLHHVLGGSAGNSVTVAVAVIDIMLALPSISFHPLFTSVLLYAHRISCSNLMSFPFLILYTVLSGIRGVGDLSLVRSLG
jgi:hypothetical protein